MVNNVIPASVVLVFVFSEGRKKKMEEPAGHLQGGLKEGGGAVQKWRRGERAKQRVAVCRHYVIFDPIHGATWLLQQHDPVGQSWSKGNPTFRWSRHPTCVWALRPT